MQHYFQLFFLLVVFTSLITLKILFNQETKFITDFSQGEFIRPEKVVFLFKRSHVRLKETILFTKKCIR